MNKVLKRVLLICIFFPFLFFILIFIPSILPTNKFILFNLATIVIAFIGAREIKNLAMHKNIPTFSLITPLLSASVPLAAYLQILNILPDSFLSAWILTAISIPFIISLGIAKKEQIHFVLEKSAISLLNVVYPGLFLSFIILMTQWANASFKILFFLCLVFINDMLAYITGKLFGKKLNLIVSPNKTLIGFIGGFIGSLLTAVVFYFIYPGLFGTTLIGLLLFSALIGVATITGDLVESALKRSSGVKDSGMIMMGRGGVMDSIDSLLFSAPLFYYLFPSISNMSLAN